MRKKFQGKDDKGFVKCKSGGGTLNSRKRFTARENYFSWSTGKQFLFGQYSDEYFPKNKNIQRQICQKHKHIKNILQKSFYTKEYFTQD